MLAIFSAETTKRKKAVFRAQMRLLTYVYGSITEFSCTLEGAVVPQTGVLVDKIDLTFLFIREVIRTARC